jgi:hypothetical protein
MARRLFIYGLVVVMCAAGVGTAIYASIGSADPGPGVCLKRPLHVMVGHGQSPEGAKWYVAASLKNDAKCSSRLLEVSFHPFGPNRIRWGAGYGVPVGGSLSSTFVIASQLAKGTEEIAYGGVTSNKVATVEALTRGGGWIKIRPERPRMRTVPKWLWNVRYFMEYLPANEKVERIRVRDRVGRVLYQGGESVFGEFDDVGVL